MEEKGFGKRINQVRKDRGLTAEKLSEACGINAVYLRQIEGGIKIPSKQEIAAAMIRAVLESGKG